MIELRQNMGLGAERQPFRLSLGEKVSWYLHLQVNHRLNRWEVQFLYCLGLTKVKRDDKASIPHRFLLTSELSSTESDSLSDEASMISDSFSERSNPSTERSQADSSDSIFCCPRK